MVHVAREMQRLGFEQPLLIGGATTSPAHTAVRIDPQYAGPVVHVKDASRAVGVCQQLITPDTKPAYVAQLKSEHARRREQHRNKGARSQQLPLAQARAHKFNVDWSGYTPPRPSFLGVSTFEDYPLRELVPYIDWMPFFNAWEFAGKFPDILADPVIGAAASALYADARKMLETLIAEKWLGARAVIGLFPANSVDDDDIAVFADEARRTRLVTLHQLRQQKAMPEGHGQWCLADWVAPAALSKPDYIGAFAVTAGIGIDEHVKRFEAAHDDYNAILLKALADRLAEAFAEKMHERVRCEFWAYAPTENLDPDALLAERYRGIRPAPGYPACPDHTGKAALWKLLDAEANSGIRLTESYAMLPTAAVSGFYFAHPDARYFAVGKIDRDQAQSYAQRKGAALAETERWLAPNLSYEPSAAADAAETADAA